jgi:hypothetical protein
VRPGLSTVPYRTELERVHGRPNVYAPWSTCAMMATFRTPLRLQSVNVSTGALSEASCSKDVLNDLLKDGVQKESLLQAAQRRGRDKDGGIGP